MSGRSVLLDPYTLASAALLVAGSDAALTGLTAAWLHGCPAAEFPTVHVAVPSSRSLRAKDGLVVHQGRRLLDDVIEVRGLRSVPLVVAATELLCTETARRALAVIRATAEDLREPSALLDRLDDALRSGERRAAGLASTSSSDTVALRTAIGASVRWRRMLCWVERPALG